MSEVNDLSVGDTVSLKSGGPDMTVSGFDNGWVECTFWNKETKKFDKINLDSRTLEKGDD